MLSKIVAFASRKRSKSTSEKEKQSTQQKPPSTPSGSTKMRWGLMRRRGKALSGTDLRSTQSPAGTQGLSGSLGNLANGGQGQGQGRGSFKRGSRTSSRQSQDGASTVVDDVEYRRSKSNDVTARLSGDQPIVKHDDIFPSLSHTFLADHNLLSLPSSATTNQDTQDLTEEQLKEKFDLLSMAFKSDAETMSQRLAVHLRNRSTTEQNARTEIVHIKDYSRSLMAACSDSHSRDLCTKLQSHIDILEYAIVRLSGKAELCGAAQQELRLGRAIELMFQHVEGLQAKYKREHNELQHMLKPLQGALERQNSFLSDVTTNDMKALLQNQKLQRRQSEKVPSASADSNNNSQSASTSTIKTTGSDQIQAEDNSKRFAKSVSTTALPSNLAGSSLASHPHQLSNGVRPATSTPQLVRRATSEQQRPVSASINTARNPTNLLHRRQASSANLQRNRRTCRHIVKLAFKTVFVFVIILFIAVITFFMLLPDDDTLSNLL